LDAVFREDQAALLAGPVPASYNEKAAELKIPTASKY
jgi:hypothetical protein